VLILKGIDDFSIKNYENIEKLKLILNNPTENKNE